MTSMARHALDIDLDDKTWFRYAAFDGKSSLRESSVTKLDSLPALALLSGGAETCFAFLMFAIWIFSYYLQANVAPLLAFMIVFGSALFVFIAKRIAIYRKYGFGSQWVMTVSKEKLEVAKLAQKNKKAKALTINKCDISEIVFNYTMDKKYKHKVGGGVVKNSARVHACEIHLKNGELIDIDGMRVGLFNLLYLLVFHEYPLVYRYCLSGGAGGAMILVLRLLSLSAVASAVAMLFFNLK